jgi:hypothetical protein
VNALIHIQRPNQIPSKHFNTFLLLCCWHIWKWRNIVVFRNDRSTLAGALAACKAEAFLWKARLPEADKHIAEAWCTLIANDLALGPLNEMRQVVDPLPLRRLLKTNKQAAGSRQPEHGHG